MTPNRRSSSETVKSALLGLWSFCAHPADAARDRFYGHEIIAVGADYDVMAAFKPMASRRGNGDGRVNPAPATCRAPARPSRAAEIGRSLRVIRHAVFPSVNECPDHGQRHLDGPDRAVAGLLGHRDDHALHGRHGEPVRGAGQAVGWGDGKFPLSRLPLGCG